VKSFCRGPAGWRSAHRPVEPTYGDVVRASGAYPSAKVIAVSSVAGEPRAATLAGERSSRAATRICSTWCGLLRPNWAAGSVAPSTSRSRQHAGCPRPARSFGGSARGMLGCEPPGSSLGRLSGGHPTRTLDALRALERDLGRPPTLHRARSSTASAPGTRLARGRTAHGSRDPHRRAKTASLRRAPLPPSQPNRRPEAEPQARRPGAP